MSQAISNEDLQCFVPQVTFEQIPIRNLVSNQIYQRMLSSKHVRRVASNFDPYQINPVKVSRRNGVNFVFNGQHTIEIIALVSGSRDTPVWCMVYHDIAYEEEADIFANQMRFNKPLTPYEIFNANIEAGNDKQLIIKGLVESYHFEVSSKKMHNGICAIGALEYIFDRYGYHTLDRTLRLCVNAWEGDVNSLSANMLKGLARMIVSYGDELKDDQFIDRVGRSSARDVSRTARERRSGSIGYAEAMVNAYNYRVKYGLRIEKLYVQQPCIDDLDIEENASFTDNQSNLFEECSDECDES